MSASLKNNERAFKSFCSQNLQSHISKSNIYSSLLLCKIVPLTLVVCTSMHTNVDMPRIISNSRGHVIWNKVKVCHTLLLFRKVSRVADMQYWSHMLHRTVLQMSTPCSASFPHSLSCGCNTSQNYLKHTWENVAHWNSSLTRTTALLLCLLLKPQRKLPFRWIWSMLIPSILC